MSHLPPRKRMDLYEFWLKHLLAWQSSDMNQREYCEANDLPLKRFGNWRATLRHEMPPPPKRLLYRRSVIVSHMTKTVAHKETQGLIPGYLPPPPKPLRRRSYFSSADKRNIVAELDKPGHTVSSVARRYGIASRSLFRWKQEYGPKPKPVIVPVTIIESEAPATAPAQTADLAPVRPPATPGIEITLKSGHHMRVPVDVDPKAVSALLSQLESTSS